MNAIDTVRSLFKFISAAVSPTACKLVLESSIEDVTALMKSNVVCVTCHDDVPLTPTIILADIRKLRIGVHVIHSDAVTAFSIVRTLRRALAAGRCAYYEYTTGAPSGTLITGTAVGWDKTQIQFLRVEHDYGSAYWMCELELSYKD